MTGSDWKAILVQTRGKRTRIADDLCCVVLAEFLHFSQAQCQCCDSIPMRVVNKGRVDLLFQHFTRILVRQNDPSLRPEETLMSRTEQQLSPFSQRVLKLAARDQSQDVGTVKTNKSAVFS